MSRGGYKINRSAHDYVRSERVSWLDQFAETIDKASKTAVEVARERDFISLHDQINSIVSRKPAYATVEDVVEDYQKRTGLVDYLKAQSNPGETSDKVAFSLSQYDDVFAEYPAIRDKIMSFAKNKVSTSYGQVSVPAIQREIFTQFASDGLQPQDVDNEEVAKFISDLITEAQRETPPSDLSSVELGKGVGVIDVDEDDEENNDFYRGLMPNTD